MLAATNSHSPPCLQCGPLQGYCQNPCASAQSPLTKAYLRIRCREEDCETQISSETQHTFEKESGGLCVRPGTKNIRLSFHAHQVIVPKIVTELVCTHGCTQHYYSLLLTNNISWDEGEHIFQQFLCLKNALSAKIHFSEYIFRVALGHSFTCEKCTVKNVILLCKKMHYFTCEKCMWREMHQTLVPLWPHPIHSPQILMDKRLSSTWTGARTLSAILL